MIRSLLMLFVFCSAIYPSQILLVVADDFNTSKASLEVFEDGVKVFDDIEVNIGRAGLGWGVGSVEFVQKKGEPVKVEGDGKAPAGVFALTHAFGYDKNSTLKLPYLRASRELICVDDRASKFYNTILDMPESKPKSYELMLRDDHQYELGVVVAHNESGKSGYGSCIFLHVSKTENSATAGCTAMKLEELKQIVSWLDPIKKPKLIQIPRSSAEQVLRLYPELNSSKILR